MMSTSGVVLISAMAEASSSPPGAPTLIDMPSYL
jgi:hypothetical protein